MQGKWDGQTERRRYPNDHDSLIQCLTLLAEHVKNFDQHVEDDKVLSKKVDFSTKMIYIAMGAIGVLQLIGIFKH